MGRLRILVVLAITLGLGIPTAGADTFLLKAIRQAPPNGPGGIPRPTRGMTMTTVLKRYGVPVKKLPAVGKPPITRWVYKEVHGLFRRPPRHRFGGPLPEPAPKPVSVIERRLPAEWEPQAASCLLGSTTTATSPRIRVLMLIADLPSVGLLAVKEASGTSECLPSIRASARSTGTQTK